MNTKKGIKIFRLLFLALVVILACQSCLTTQTVASGNIIYVKGKKDYLRIHEGDSSWMVGNYLINGKTVSGQLLNKDLPFPKGEILDLYLAPDGAAKITRDSAFFNIGNIGKAEYTKLDAIKTSGVVIAILMVFVWFVPAFSY